MRVLRITGFAVAAVFVLNVVWAWPVVYPLTAAPANPSGMNLISLPLVNPLLDAEDLLDDIDLQAGAAVALSVSRYLQASVTFQSYTGTSGTAFPLVDNEAYFVQVAAGVPGYTIFGGDVPFAAVALGGPGPANPIGLHTLSLPDDNAVALADAKGLVDSIPATLAVFRWSRATGSFQSYTGASGVGWALVPGEGYLVQTSAASAFVFP